MHRISVAVLFVLVVTGLAAGGTSVVTDEAAFDHDQKKIDLRPKRIGRKGNGTFTLVEALDLVARDTGNPVRRNPDCETKDEARKLELRKRTFWEAISTISEEWKVPVSELASTLGSVTPEEWKQAGRTKPPVPSSAREIASQVDGLFRLTVFESNESRRQTHLVLEGEPRLVSMALTWTQATLTGDSPGSAVSSGPPAAGVRNIVVYNPNGLDLANKTNLKFDLHASYFHDWRTTKLGKLSNLDEKKETKAGAAGIRIGPRQSRKPLTVRAHWATRLFVEPALVLIDGKTKEQHTGEPVSYTRIGGWQFRFPTVTADTALRNLEVELRAPRRVKKLQWTIQVPLPASK